MIMYFGDIFEKYIIYLVFYAFFFGNNFVENAHTVNNFGNLVDNILHMNNLRIVRVHPEIYLSESTFLLNHIRAYLSLQSKIIISRNL